MIKVKNSKAVKGVKFGARRGTNKRRCIGATYRSTVGNTARTNPNKLIPLLWLCSGTRTEVQLNGLVEI